MRPTPTDAHPSQGSGGQPATPASRSDIRPALHRRAFAGGFALVEQEGRVAIPDDDHTRYVDVSVWDDSEDNLARFAANLGLSRRSSRRLVTSAVLVHHAHNTYNPRAISVSRPAASGGSTADRHLGYLRDNLLNRIGATNLPDLIAYAGGEMEVTIRVTGTDELEVALPDGATLGDAIRDFLEARGITAAGAPRWGDTPPKVHHHTGTAPETIRSLRLLRSAQSTPGPVASIVAATEPAHDPEHRDVTITETGSGRFLGTITAGVLNLHDEQIRDQVLPLLHAEDLPVAQPVTDPHLTEDGSWPAGEVPNAWVRIRGGSLDLRVHDPDEPNSQESFAIFNPTNDTLWVEDSHMVAPALRFFHRMGINPTALGLPRKAWALDTEISYRSLRARVNVNDRLPLPPPPLLSRHRPLVPKGVLTGHDVTWFRDPEPLAEPPENFLRLERHVTARAGLFPEHELTSAIVSCRLCGGLAAAFTTPISTAPIAYCHRCLDAARDGLVEDRRRAAASLAQLSTLEFDGQPMLETQLATLHVNPADPVEPGTLDQLLLLRWGVGRKRVAWTLLLEAAGFAENGLRTGRGTLIRSRDGHLCLSMREKTVCDFLHLHGVAHEREPRYPLDPEYNSSGLRRADWKLSDGTLVELWGLPNDPQYAAKMDQKRLLAARHGLRLVELDDRNLPKLPAIFAAWIDPGTVTGWTWSPLLVASPTAAEAARLKKENAAARGDDRGRNDFNAHTQRERVARCAEAVQHQRGGLSRSEIGDRMGASVEGVKLLLRDGKFYADPTTDPVRYDLATKAAEARRAGQTRAQFQADQQSSTPKAQEAWRDAGVLFDE